MCAIPKDHVGRGALFVTLTYPGQYPGQWSTWKRQLDNWLHRLKRRLPKAAGVWKLEPQRRGAPHFHLYVVGCPFIAREWLSNSWYQTVRSGDERHLKAGTQVQLVRSHRGVLSYAAKYTAKHQELPSDWQDGVGRWWGVFNRDQLGIAWSWAWLSQPEFWRACRFVRRLVAARSPQRRRSHPPPHPSGTWAVLTDTQVCRILAWLDTLARPVPCSHVRLAGELSPAGP